MVPHPAMSFLSLGPTETQRITVSSQYPRGTSKIPKQHRVLGWSPKAPTKDYDQHNGSTGHADGPILRAETACKAVGLHTAAMGAALSSQCTDRHVTCSTASRAALVSRERRKKKKPRYLYKNIIILLHSTQYIFKEFQISTRYFSHTGNWATLGMSRL